METLKKEVYHLRQELQSKIVGFLIEDPIDYPIPVIIQALYNVALDFHCRDCTSDEKILINDLKERYAFTLDRMEKRKEEEKNRE